MDYTKVEKIRSIIGTRPGKAIKQLVFKKKYGIDVGQIYSCSEELSDTITLADGEQIIGLYGFFDDEDIAGMGVIVWQP